MTENEVKEILGETLHIAYRKAMDCPQSMPVWNLINEMPDGDWIGYVDAIYNALIANGWAPPKEAPH